MEYKVNGITLPTPDSEVEYTEEDMHGKSWRDGAGKMHLVVLRRGVISTPLKWSWLTADEFKTLKNACRKDMTGVYTFEDIDGEVRQVYTGADLKYSKQYYKGTLMYKNVSLSFIEM